MLSVLAALAFLGALSAAGVVLLRSVVRGLTTLELVAYGPVVGTVVGTVLILGLAAPVGLLAATIAVTLFSSIGVVLFWPRQAGTGAGAQAIAALARVGRQLGPWPAVVIGVVGLRLAFLWAGALTVDDEGLWAGHGYIWSDWTLHLGDTASFAYADNFPPTHPRLAGAPIAYHYLISVTAAGMVVLGMDPIAALPLQSFLFSIALLLAIHAFVLRLGGGRAVASLGLVLFIFGGSLGWLLLFDGSAGSPLDALLSNPWDIAAQQAANFRWLNPYFALIMSQRAALYGIPIVLLVLTITLMSARAPGWRPFAIAGLVAGFLPIAHISGFAALAMIAPLLVLLLPNRGWIAFFAAWVLVGGVILFGVQGGEARASSSLRWEPGWLTGDDPWLWFWVKSFGLYLPLGAVGLLVRDLLPVDSRRLLLAFLPIFVVSNLFLLGAYDWDNSKVLLYVFLALSVLSAAALAGLWRVQRDVVSRALIVLAVMTMIGSGLLTNLSQAMGNDRTRLASAADLEVAAWARSETAPDAVFAVGLEHNDPIPMLSGRRVITSYAPWITNLGLDPSRQEADLRAIMRFDAAAPELLAEYGIDYVAIGQWEIDELDANVDAFAERYPIVFESDEYRVFRITG